jgi:hypothetical protein
MFGRYRWHSKRDRITRHFFIVKRKSQLCSSFYSHNLMKGLRFWDDGMRILSNSMDHGQKIDQWTSFEKSCSWTKNPTLLQSTEVVWRLKRARMLLFFFFFEKRHRTYFIAETVKLHKKKRLLLTVTSKSNPYPIKNQKKKHSELTPTASSSHTISVFYPHPIK